MASMHHFINDDIIIDFKLPKLIQNVILELEELDKEEDYCYFDYSSALDNIAKSFYADGVLTKKQWELLAEKYNGG